MAFRAFFVFLVPFIFSLNVQAQDIQLNPTHPQQYTVVKGDTLWGISAKFLQNPWQWREVWQNNSQIENPHLIYPGDTIYLRYVDGQPQLSLTPDAGEFGGFQPRIREIPHEEAITTIPIDAIAQFLTSPRIVSQWELDDAPYIIDMVGEHLIAGSGDQIYVRSIINPSALGFTVYRPGETFLSPVTGELLGYEALYVANVTLQSAGDPAKLLITKSSQQVTIGDRLLPNPEEAVTINFIPRPPSNDIKGSIISVMNGVTQVGQFNVVVIDQGIRDGIEAGHVLEILKLGEIVRDPYSKLENAAVKLPDETAGYLMVFRPFDRVSYAVVMESSQAIKVMDKVQNP